MTPFNIIKIKNGYIFQYPFYYIQTPNYNAANFFANPVRPYTITGLTFSEANLIVPKLMDQQNVFTELKFSGELAAQQPDAIPFFYYTAANFLQLGDFSGVINFKANGAPVQSLLHNKEWTYIGNNVSNIDIPKELFATTELVSTSTTPVRTVDPSKVAWAYTGRLQFTVKQTILYGTN